MKRSGFKRKATVPMKRTPLARVSPNKKKVQKTKRAKKQELKKSICEQYNIPILPCSRYGEGKSPTRQDILKGILWFVFSRYIRHRDTGTCISCGEYKTFAELQAGHFVPAGGNDLDLLFNPYNVHGECPACNADFQGNGWHLILMRKNMVAKYGETMVLNLEEKSAKKEAVKWDEEMYVKLIKFYSELSTLPETNSTL